MSHDPVYPDGGSRIYPSTQQPAYETQHRPPETQHEPQGHDIQRRDVDATGVAETAKQDLRSVTKEISGQAQRVASDVGVKAREQVALQQREWAQQLQTIADELHEMAAQRPDTPARALVSELAQRSAGLADYLSQHRPEDLLDEIRAFARRRPGAFIATCVAAGFVVGRLGKGVQAGTRTAIEPAENGRQS